MSMLEWAEREVKIASEHERGEKPESEWDYGVACYESALKAYRCLCEDGHSGFSWRITAEILERLCKGHPLTPVEDTDDEWIELEPKMLQHKRLGSLFKDVTEDGTITYRDVQRVCCCDLDSDTSYHLALVDDVINSMFPIRMPYMPSTNPFVAYCEDFLTDRNNGDFDTVGIYYVVKPDGEKVEINKFYKESDTEPGWTEISYEEYTERKAKQMDRFESR